MMLSVILAAGDGGGWLLVAAGGAGGGGAAWSLGAGWARARRGEAGARSAEAGTVHGHAVARHVAVMGDDANEDHHEDDNVEREVDDGEGPQAADIDRGDEDLFFGGRRGGGVGHDFGG